MKRYQTYTKYYKQYAWNYYRRPDVAYKRLRASNVLKIANLERRRVTLLEKTKYRVSQLERKRDTLVEETKCQVADFDRRIQAMKIQTAV